MGAMMKRRTFINLAGMFAAFWLPTLARATQRDPLTSPSAAPNPVREDVPEHSEGTIIRVIGVGGAGGNTVDHMIREGVGVSSVEFIVANTDAQALNRSLAGYQLQLGKDGLGAGGNPEAGRNAALEVRERIADSLRGAHMVFIVAGMGGGTGTGAAPVIAEVARELGILTVAIVTKPFGFEGNRLKVADAGITELQKHVNSLIVILNDKLLDVLGGNASMVEAFKAADDVSRNAVGTIADMVNIPGLVNVDFEDVRCIMDGMGMAMTGSGSATGLDRARSAAEQAIASPLLEGIPSFKAPGVLVNITATRSLKMREVNEIMNTVRAFSDEDAHIIFGAAYDESVGESIRVTVIAAQHDRRYAS
jgi:cell division protein FtsZ